MGVLVSAEAEFLPEPLDQAPGRQSGEPEEENTLAQDQSPSTDRMAAELGRLANTYELPLEPDPAKVMTPPSLRSRSKPDGFQVLFDAAYKRTFGKNPPGA